MSLQEIYKSYLKSGYSYVRNYSAGSGDESFYLALLAFAENELADAVRFASLAEKLEPTNCVFSQGIRYLNSLLEFGKNNVYIDDKGFNAFINGGANIALYKETSNALYNIYTKYDQFSLFDIGVGDGKALLPAITGNIKHVDLLEPSEMMLKRLCSKLDAEYDKQSYNAFCCTFQNFTKERRRSNNYFNSICEKPMRRSKRYAGQAKITKSPDHQITKSQWDIIQGTFSLHSFSNEERMDVLVWLRKHGRRVLIAEFDVPDFKDIFAPERYLHIIKCYLKGLSEYNADRDLVAQGFLMPVMFGYFDKSIYRTTYEQPIQKWVDNLKKAGFKKVNLKKLYPYWWADAYIIDAC
jgi:hypothetical protein